MRWECFVAYNANVSDNRSDPYTVYCPSIMNHNCIGSNVTMDQKYQKCVRSDVLGPKYVGLDISQVLKHNRQHFSTSGMVECHGRNTSLRTM
jgi:hypothetical protein